MFYLTGDHIYLTRGDTAYMVINLKNADGTAYEPAQGDSLRFALKTSFDATSCAIKKDIDLTGETITLKIVPADTKLLKQKDFVYDIELTTALGDVTTIISDRFTLLNEVD